MLKRFCHIILVLFACIISVGVQSADIEYNLKAGFIYNFTHYIEWEELSTNTEFIIGVIGFSPITEALEDISNKKTVNTKKIIIRHFNKADEITYCNILFIPKNIHINLDEILENIKSKNILTVSEQEGYAKLGTAINFVVVNEKIKFEVNIKTINSAGLKASSQLLKLAIFTE